MKAIAGASFASLFGLLICMVPAVAGALYAFRPRERLLALMRPLTLAGVFSGLCGFCLALVNGFGTVGRMQALDAEGARICAIVLAEGMAPVAASFACLTVAWGLVAIGMRRQ